MKVAGGKRSAPTGKAPQRRMKHAWTRWRSCASPCGRGCPPATFSDPFGAGPYQAQFKNSAPVRFCWGDANAAGWNGQLGRSRRQPAAELRHSQRSEEMGRAGRSTSGGRVARHNGPVARSTKQRQAAVGSAERRETGKGVWRFWSAVTCHHIRQATGRRLAQGRVRSSTSRFRAALLRRQVGEAGKAVTSHRTPHALALTRTLQFSAIATRSLMISAPVSSSQNLL